VVLSSHLQHELGRVRQFEAAAALGSSFASPALV